jgi:hypothetical protein
MKKYLIVLIFSLLFLNGKTQIIFETQQQVDSFVVVMDTSINNYYHFYYDDLLPESERITDLSGFDEDGWLYIKLFYFEIEDMPWFKSFHQGQIHFINMPHLKTFSGLKNINRSLVGINNCPSLKSFPPTGFFQYNSELWISNQDMEQFELNFKDVSENPRGGSFSNRVQFYNNNITRLIINDPNGAARRLDVLNDSSLQYLEVNSGVYQRINIKGNIILDSIRGFNSAETIVADVLNNPILTDLCAMRYGWGNHYESLPQRDKDNWKGLRIDGNGTGANTYEEMMATDCSWMADTFTTVAEQKVVDQSNASIYPNPISRLSGTVSISISSEKSISNIQITNLQGQRVFSISQAEGSTAQVAINNYTAGVYAVQIIDSSGGLSKKKLVIAEL